MRKEIDGFCLFKSKVCRDFSNMQLGKSFVHLTVYHMTIFQQASVNLRLTEVHRVTSVHIAHSNYHALYSVARLTGP